jgi:hypothetical protein
MRHVEYFHDHVRLDRLLFDGLPRVAGGAMVIDPSVPGHGISLMEEDAKEYRIA